MGQQTGTGGFRRNHPDESDQRIAATDHEGIPESRRGEGTQAIQKR